MKTITATELQNNMYQLLEEVLQTGTPIEVHTHGRKLLISPIAEQDKLKNLVSRPEVFLCPPEDLAELNWEGEVQLDLP